MQIAYANLAIRYFYVAFVLAELFPFKKENAALLVRFLKKYLSQCFEFELTCSSAD